ncbi:hypothetical protein QTO34_006897 [Cnephaeus nilssonii]|uniref:Uncharacterized protein n=1 Tax=Cnephaeus nilssonii TaxID=3371016 RepID=A0AA40HK40_CNENI|nr:hypothetical protein QTO34_006897 [Eptesicus nilssonii]
MLYLAKQYTEFENIIFCVTDENFEVTTDTTEIQRIVRKYYEQLYVNKLDNVDEMDKFLEKYDLPKLSQEESENLNRPITTEEIEANNTINLALITRTTFKMAPQVKNPKRTTWKFGLDLTHSVEDGIFNYGNFEPFLWEKVKVNGKIGNLWNAVYIEYFKNKISPSQFGTFWESGRLSNLRVQSSEWTPLWGGIHQKIMASVTVIDSHVLEGQIEKTNKQQLHEQSTPIQGVAAARASCPSPRSNSRTSSPPSSKEQQLHAAHTLHPSEEQQLCEQSTPIQGAGATRASCPSLRSSSRTQPTPVRRASARISSYVSSTPPSKEQQPCKQPSPVQGAATTCSLPPSEEQQPHEQPTPSKEQQLCKQPPPSRQRNHHCCKQDPPEELLTTEEQPLP